MVDRRSVLDLLSDQTGLTMDQEDNQMSHYRSEKGLKEVEGLGIPNLRLRLQVGGKLRHSKTMWERRVVVKGSREIPYHSLLQPK